MSKQISADEWDLALLCLELSVIMGLWVIWFFETY